MDTVPENLFLLQNEEQTGPFPQETIRQMLQLGSVSPGDFAWAEGMDDWVTLESLFGQPVAAAASATKPKKRKKKKTGSFGAFIGDAMAYPFRGYGWIILLSGTVVLSGIQWFQMLPISIGLLNLFLSLSAWGYLLVMLQNVIQRTALGESDLPDWPDFEGFGELIGKCFQWFVVLMVCFGPALFIVFNMAREDGGDPELRSLVLVWTAVVAGAVYCPMALLAVAMFDTVGAVNPMLVVRSISQVPHTIWGRWSCSVC